MKTVKEITQETVDSFIETMSLTIFYEKVADELQTTAPEGYGFDCRKISISNEIQEQWIQQFEEKLGKEHLPELIGAMELLSQNAGDKAGQAKLLELRNALKYE